MGINKTHLLTALFLLCANLLVAQNQVVHTIEQGNTVFGLAQEYGSSVEAIYEANPEIGVRNLVIGETLIIPLPEREVIDSTRFTFHTVRSFESVYSISRKYEIKDSTIYWHNPVLKNSPIVKKGQVLRIPNDAESWRAVRDTFVTLEPNKRPKYVVYEVVFGDSPESLAQQWGFSSVEQLFQINPDARNQWYEGMHLVRPVDKQVATQLEIQHVELPVKNVYRETDTIKVVGVLPFFTKDYVHQTAIAKRSAIALSFRQGMEAAKMLFPDSSMHIELSYIDTYNNKDTLSTYVDEQLVHQTDLFVGPLYAERVVQLSKIVPEEKIASPLSKNPMVGGTAVWNAQVQEDVLWNALAEYLKSNTDHEKDLHKYLLVGQNNERSLKRKLIIENAIGGENILYISNDASWAANERLVSLDTTIGYTLIVLENDPAFLLDVLRNTRQGKFKYTWITLETQIVGRGLVNDIFEREDNVYALFSGFVDYELRSTLEFVAAFRKLFGREPDKYAITAFDVLTFHLNRLKSGYTSMRGIDKGFDYNGIPGHNTYVELRHFKDHRWGFVKELDVQEIIQ